MAGLYRSRAPDESSVINDEVNLGSTQSRDRSAMDFEDRLDKILRTLNVHHACEVGVYLPKDSKIMGLALGGIRCTFVEPEGDAFSRLEESVGHLENVRLVNAAIAHGEGTVTLVMAGASSFLLGLESPAIVNDRLAEESARTEHVPAITFDAIDDGSIDYLRVDTEGSEWYVIENLVSRPDVIVLELFGKRYVNPYSKQLRAWLKEHDYFPVLMDRSDVVFFKKGSVNPSLSDRIRYRVQLSRVYLRLVRKRLFS